MTPSTMEGLHRVLRHSSALALVLSVVPAFGGGITVDQTAPSSNQAQMTQSAPNTGMVSVPVENIATPNANGLSHNMFTDFNVGTDGLVINNSKTVTGTSLGGPAGGGVTANPNLANGEASIILNEVTGTGASSLLGPQQLVGGKADYILANPNGIAVNGGAFLNFSRVTLATGKPQITGGALTGMSITGGTLTIGANGVDASAIDGFDLLSRAMSIQGTIAAKKLRLIAGCNAVDYATGATTAQTCGAGASPVLAIDSTALGGMKADQISLIATEKGVGVRMRGDMAASAGDITLSANGKITMSGNKVSAKTGSSGTGNIKVISTETSASAPDVVLDGAQLYAQRDLALSGNGIALTGGSTGAGGDLSVTGTSYSDSGAGQRTAGGALHLDVGGAVTIDGSSLASDKGADISAGALTVENGGTIVAAQNDGTAGLTATVKNALTLAGGGIASFGTETISADTISVDQAANGTANTGLHSVGAGTITAGTSINSAGYIAGDGGLTMTAPSLTITATGTATSNKVASLNAGAVKNGGYIGGDGGLALNIGQLDNTSTGTIQSAGAITFQQSVVNAPSGATLVLTNENGGTIQGDTVSAIFDTIDNSGTLASTGALTLSTKTLTNEASGLVSSSGSVTVNGITGATAALTNKGVFQSAGAMTLDLGTLDNAAGATMYGSSVTATNIQSLTNSGTLQSDGVLSLAGLSVAGTTPSSSFTNNAGGVVTAAGAVTLKFATLKNQGLVTGDSLTVGTPTSKATTLTNNGTLQASGAMTLNAETLTNQANSAKAVILAGGDIAINATAGVSNTSGTGNRAQIVSQGGTLTITATDTASMTTVTNAGGLLFAAGDLTIALPAGGDLTNKKSGSFEGYIFSTGGNITLGGAGASPTYALTVKNIDSHIESQTGNVAITATSFDNTTDTSTVPTTTTVSSTIQASNAAYWYDANNGNTYPVFDACGTYADGSYQPGDSCVPIVSVVTQTLAAGTSAAPRSQVLAGKDIDITVSKEATNYLSLLSAGRNVNITGPSTATFTNQALVLTKTEVAAIYTDKDTPWLPGCIGQSSTDNCYTTLVWDTGLGVYVIEYHLKDWNTQPEVVTTTSFGINSTVEAGGTVNITGLAVTNSNGTTKNNAASTAITPPSKAGQTTPSTSTITFGSLTLSGPTIPGIQTLAQSPFFVQVTTPGSPYVYVTDPTLISLKGLYGSNLLLRSLGYDPSQYQRLGDAYYEQQLVRQQLLAEAGQRFIEAGATDENAQYKQLLDNGAQAAKSLNLRLGVALTADQINNLQKDVVWLVNETVNGKTVLVPKLYLASATQLRLASGAKIVASNINVKTDGPVTNSGAFVATNNINVATGQSFTNRLGSVQAGKSLTITAQKDINNLSGTMQGNDVSLTTKEGSVNIKTLTKDHKVSGAFGSGTDTQVGQTASVTATNNLTVNSGKDVNIAGGAVSATNGDINAKNDVNVTTIEKKRYDESYSHTVKGSNANTTTTSTQSTHNVGSTIDMSGDLKLQAGNDANVHGSTVNVNSKADIGAGHDVNVTAAQDTSTTHTVSTDTTMAGTSGKVGAENNPAQNAAQNKIDQVSAQGNVELYGEKKTTTDTTATTAQGSQINVGGNVTLDAKHDTNIVGSTVASGGDATVTAGHDVNLKAAENKTDITSSSTDNSFNLKGQADLNSSSGGFGFNNETTSGTENKTDMQVSQIASGGNMKVSAGHDVNTQGTQAYSAGDMNVEAKNNINDVAAKNTDHTTGTVDKTTASLTAGADYGVGDIAKGVTSGNATQVASTVANTAATLSDPASAVSGNITLSVEHSHTTNTGDGSNVTTSSFTSGGNLTLKSGKDTNLQGTQIDAGGNANVTAGHDVNLTAAANTQSSTSETTSGGGSLSVTGSAGGVGGSASGSYSKDTSSQGSSTAVVASIHSGGDTTIKAGNDVTAEGTNVDAGGNVTLKAENGKVTYKAAHDTYTSSAESTSASASISASEGGGGGSGSYAHQTSSVNSSTAVVGSISGKNVTVEGKGDVTLEGTNVAATNGATVESTNGSVNLKAATSTYDSTTNGISGGGSVSGSKSKSAANTSHTAGKQAGGAVSLNGGVTNESEHDNIQQGGSISGANITIKGKNDVTLQGTTVDATNSATVDAGRNLKIETAQSTKTSTNNDVSLGLSGSGSSDTRTNKHTNKKEGGDGGGGVSAAWDISHQQSTTNSGGTVNAGGKLTLKSGGDYTQAGGGVSGGTVDKQIGGKEIDQTRTDSSSGYSHKGKVDVQVTVPKHAKDHIKSAGKKAKKVGGKIKEQATYLKEKTARLGTKAKTHLGNAKNTVGHKLDVAATHVGNKATKLKNKVTNSNDAPKALPTAPVKKVVPAKVAPSGDTRSKGESPAAFKKRQLAEARVTKDDTSASDAERQRAKAIVDKADAKKNAKNIFQKKAAKIGEQATYTKEKAQQQIKNAKIKVKNAGQTVTHKAKVAKTKLENAKTSLTDKLNGTSTPAKAMPARPTPHTAPATPQFTGATRNKGESITAFKKRILDKAKLDQNNTSLSADERAKAQKYVEDAKAKKIKKIKRQERKDAVVAALGTKVVVTPPVAPPAADAAPTVHVEAVMNEARGDALRTFTTTLGAAQAQATTQKLLNQPDVQKAVTLAALLKRAPRDKDGKISAKDKRTMLLQLGLSPAKNATAAQLNDALDKVMNAGAAEFDKVAIGDAHLDATNSAALKQALGLGKATTP